VLAAANLGIVMRKILGAGTPRSLQGRLAALLALLSALADTLNHALFFVNLSPPLLRHEQELPIVIPEFPRSLSPAFSSAFSTGC
jgi:hypothetical protein